MNSLKLGPVSIQRARVPACTSCARRHRIERECALCSGTGSYLACDSCGHELINEGDDCFEVTIPPQSKAFDWRSNKLVICFDCVALTIAEALPELPKLEADWEAVAS